MALNTGVFNTTINPSELNARSFAGTILRLFPNGSAPIFALTSMVGKSSAKSTTHGYFSKTMSFVKTTASSAVADTGEQEIPVASTVGMVPSMVLQNVRTRENLRILSVDSATQITVTRAFGRVNAAAINSADVLLAIGTAHEEGSVRPLPRRITTTYVPNYTQIFRNAWALTDTARASLAEAGYSNITEDRKDCAMFHSIDIESAIIWGQPKMDTTGAQPVHATQGVIDALEQYAPENTNAALATTDYAQLVELVEPAFKYSTDLSNPKERLAFCDSTSLKVLHDIGRKSGQVQIMQDETSFGMQFTKFKFYKGTINLIEHPLFNGLGQTMMLIMDMPALKLAYLNGRDTKAEEYNTGGKVVENGVDSVGGSLTTELAVELINPYACALVTGLTEGVAEPLPESGGGD
jgi:hypothetical protein